MATTPHMVLELLEQSQAQKEVTVNDALFRIDAVLNSGAITRGGNTPPVSPQDGDVYIVGAAPTGAWAGKALQIAYFHQIWRFIIPRAGMLMWVIADNNHVVYNGTVWNVVISSGWTTVYDQSVTASGGVDITNLASYKVLRASLSLSVSGASGIVLRTSNTNGSSFYSGASDYLWGHVGIAGSENSLTDTRIQLGNAALSTARKTTLIISNLSDANLPTFAEYRTMHEGTFQLYQGFGYRAAAVAEDALRILPTAGTMTGRIKLEAM